jgi:hypothetical protein
VDLIGSAGAQGSTAGTFLSGFGGGSELLELDESTSGSKAGFVMLKFLFYNFERYAAYHMHFFWRAAGFSENTSEVRPQCAIASRHSYIG